MAAFAQPMGGGSPLYLTKNQYYTTASGVDDTEPVTIALKFKADAVATGTVQTMAAVCRSTAGHYLRYGLGGSSAVTLVQSWSGAGGFDSTAVAAGQLYIGVGQFASGTSRKESLNGAAYTTGGTDSAAVASTDRVVIGALNDSGTIKDGFQGHLYWVCIWGGSVDITRDEAMAIGFNGSSPLDYQNNDITFYQDFTEGINGPSQRGPILGGLQTF